MRERRHGQRLYDWAAIDIRPWREPDRGHWLLARHSITDPEQVAYYLCYGPADTELTELVRRRCPMGHRGMFPHRQK
jgi:hypothetical protein